MQRTPTSADRPQVVHIATRYLRGGSERRILDIVRALPEGDHHLIVGSGSDPALARAQLQPASLTIVPALVRDPSPLRDPVALVGLTSALRRLPHDLVITHQSKAGVLGRIAAGRTRGAPVVHSLSMANFGPGYPTWQDVLFRRIEARLQRRTAAYAAAGRDLVDRYTAIGIAPGKLRVVRSGVDLSTCRPLAEAERREVRERFGIPAARPALLFLGSLEARKGVLELPSLLTNIGSIGGGGSPYLVVAGEGPLRAALERDLRQAGLDDDAATIGFLADPGSLIAAVDVVVLLSQAEGLPQVLVQAAAAGTPFVAYDVDGVGELIGAGATGIAVESGDLLAAARAAERLLGRGGRAGASIDLSEWAPDRITQAYRRLLRPMLGADAVASVTDAATAIPQPRASASVESGELASGRGA